MNDYTNDILTKIRKHEQIPIPGLEVFRSFDDNTIVPAFIHSVLKNYIGIILEECHFPYVQDPHGSQSIPDYEVGNNWLMIRCFDTHSSSSFDIIRYDRLMRELEYGNKNMLYADYIVFEYKIDISDKNLYIENTSSYKIWQITECGIDYEGQKIIQINMHGMLRSRSNLYQNNSTSSNNDSRFIFKDEYEFIDTLYRSIYDADGEYYANKWLEKVQSIM